MATADDVIRIAQGEVGYSRYTDPQEGTKYGRWYAQLTGSPYFGTTGVHFCAMGVSWTFAKAGVTCKGFPTASCTGALLKPAWSGGYLIRCKDLRRGDAILFDWSGRGWQGENADHVGLVVENHGTWLETVEFNVGGEVRNCTRYPNQVVGGIRPAYSKTAFSDVTSSTPHAADIEWLKKQGIAQGYDDGSFHPNATLLRGDCAAFLHRLDGGGIFSDVTAKTAHFEDIAWMAAKAISRGYSDGTFRPGAGVSRADMAAFLYRMAGEPEFDDTSSFTDVDASTPHARAIRWLGSAGISKGYGDGTFKPFSAVTRADAAALIRRAAR